jgi:hypothetical protein
VTRRKSQRIKVKEQRIANNPSSYELNELKPEAKKRMFGQNGQQEVKGTSR